MNTGILYLNISSTTIKYFGYLSISTTLIVLFSGSAGFFPEPNRLNEINEALGYNFINSSTNFEVFSKFTGDPWVFLYFYCKITILGNSISSLIIGILHFAFIFFQKHQGTTKESQNRPPVWFVFTQVALMYVWVKILFFADTPISIEPSSDGRYISHLSIIMMYPFVFFVYSVSLVGLPLVILDYFYRTTEKRGSSK